MRTPVWPLLALTMLSAAGCGRVDPPPKPNTFQQHLDALYDSAKKFVAVSTVTKTDPDRLRSLVEMCHVHYLSARDWAATDDERLIVESYGEALPSMRTALGQTENYKTWLGMSQRSPQDAGAKLAGEAMRFLGEAAKAVDQAVEQLRKADALYVPYRRGHL